MLQIYLFLSILLSPYVSWYELEDIKPPTICHKLLVCYGFSVNYNGDFMDLIIVYNISVNERVSTLWTL